jgi:hypothetical protein
VELPPRSLILGNDGGRSNGCDTVTAHTASNYMPRI